MQNESTSFHTLQFHHTNATHMHNAINLHPSFDFISHSFSVQCLGIWFLVWIHLSNIAGLNKWWISIFSFKKDKTLCAAKILLHGVWLQQNPLLEHAKVKPTKLWSKLSFECMIVWQKAHFGMAFKVMTKSIVFLRQLLAQTQIDLVKFCFWCYFQIWMLGKFQFEHDLPALAQLQSHFQTVTSKWEKVTQKFTLEHKMFCFHSGWKIVGENAMAEEAKVVKSF